MVVAQPKIVQAEAVSSEAPSAAPAQAVSAPEKLVFEENTDPEGDQLSKFEWDYNAKIDEKLLEFDYEQSIPNANFIYHNKLPKSGSTTMHDILRYELDLTRHQNTSRGASSTTSSHQYRVINIGYRHVGDKSILVTLCW